MVHLVTDIGHAIAGATGGRTSIEPTSTTMLDGLPLCMLALNIHLIDRPWKEEQELGPQ